MTQHENELSRPIDRRQIKQEPVTLEANEQERTALAERFSIVSIESLTATIDLERQGDRIMATGEFSAAITQSCAISGEDFPVAMDEPLDIAFVPVQPKEPSDEEIELDESELDEIEYSGEQFDLGEAVAQSLGLAIDPYAEGPGADEFRKQKGLSSDDEPSGPFAALAALKK